MKQIGLARNRTVQDLLTEALNGFLQKHKEPIIALNRAVEKRVSFWILPMPGQDNDRQF